MKIIVNQTASLLCVLIRLPSGFLDLDDRKCALSTSEMDQFKLEQVERDSKAYRTKTIEITLRFRKQLQLQLQYIEISLLGYNYDGTLGGWEVGVGYKEGMSEKSC